jgi:hypothetical protein
MEPGSSLGSFSDRRAAALHVGLLLYPLDRTGTGGTHGVDCLVGLCAKLDKEPRRDEPAPPDTTEAVKHNALAMPELRPKVRAGMRPAVLEVFARHAFVTDGQLMPLQAERRSGSGQYDGRDAYSLKFSRFHERD